MWFPAVSAVVHPFFVGRTFVIEAALIFWNTFMIWISRITRFTLARFVTRRSDVIGAVTVAYSSVVRVGVGLAAVAVGTMVTAGNVIFVGGTNNTGVAIIKGNALIIFVSDISRHTGACWVAFILRITRNVAVGGASFDVAGGIDAAVAFVAVITTVGPLFILATFVCLGTFIIRDTAGCSCSWVKMSNSAGHTRAS
jgi:hypothetical protein